MNYAEIKTHGMEEVIELNGCYCCPNCGHRLILVGNNVPSLTSQFNFCQRCGQSLSWAEVQAEWQTCRTEATFRPDTLPKAKRWTTQSETREIKKPEYTTRLAKEYISKLKACDECFAETYCTIEGRRESRVPCKDIEKCADTILAYLKEENK